MKRWSLIVAGLYGASLLILTWPLVKLGFLFSKDGVDVKAILGSWQYWIWLVVLLVSQWVLLLVPADVVRERPVAKRSVMATVLAAAFAMGFLFAGLAVAVGEALAEEGSFSYFDQIFFIVLLVSWFFWGLVFARWSKEADPKNLIEKQCRTLFRGSILQLLIVVPSHILARSKDYCCAGMSTFIGIACGISVMLFSFGPAIFYLYAAQWKKLHPFKADRSRV